MAECVLCLWPYLISLCPCILLHLWPGSGTSHTVRSESCRQAECCCCVCNLPYGHYRILDCWINLSILVKKWTWLGLVKVWPHYTHVYIVTGVVALHDLCMKGYSFKGYKLYFSSWLPCMSLSIISEYLDGLCLHFPIVVGICVTSHLAHVDWWLNWMLFCLPVKTA